MPNTVRQATKPGLLRQLGFFSATALVISNMIGTGIFATPGLMAGDLGSAWLILGCWGAGALFAAWVAWLAVRQQIDAERKKRREAQLDNLWQNISYLRVDSERTVKKINELKASIEATAPLASRFDGVGRVRKLDSGQASRDTKPGIGHGDRYCRVHDCRFDVSAGTPQRSRAIGVDGF